MWEPHDLNPCYNKLFYKGTALYCEYLNILNVYSCYLIYAKDLDTLTFQHIYFNFQAITTLG